MRDMNYYMQPDYPAGQHPCMTGSPCRCGGNCGFRRTNGGIGGIFDDIASIFTRAGAGQPVATVSVHVPIMEVAKIAAIGLGTAALYKLIFNGKKKSK